MTRVKTSESVCKGHPDKICDRISDTILDEALSLDENAHVAIEALITKGKVVVAGEIKCKGTIKVRECVRRALEECGYNSDGYTISTFIHAQSEDISHGVENPLEKSESLGAGDQGTAIGYATNETEEMLPLPLVLSHRICRSLDEKRESGEIKGIFSDGKAEVVVEYEEERPVRIKSVVVSIQHDRDKNPLFLREEILQKVIVPSFKEIPIDKDTEVLINPSGSFVIGGPDADTGLTGRKLMVDTYGGLALHGGGAMSGKDPTKVDRSAAYMARYIARHIVLAGLCEKAEVTLSYAIGKAEPIAVSLNTFSTSLLPEGEIEKKVREVFPLTPEGIIRELNLRKPIYTPTSCYGHFSSAFYPWERIDEEKIKETEKLLKEGDNGREKSEV